jgi:hypothetical protein
MKFNPKFPTVASTISLLAVVLAIPGFLELRGVRLHSQFLQMDGWLLIALSVTLLIAVVRERKTES